jgi:hypothetical protein
MMRKAKKNLAKGRMPEARALATARLKANAANPAWREMVSRVTTEAMHRPDVRKRHLKGLAAQEKNNFRHGNGQPPSKLTLFAEQLLTPLEFKREYVIATKGHGTYHKAPDNYKADFANPRRKIVIELDGVSHNRQSRQTDQKKTEMLEALGWTVHRIVHGKVGSY